VRTFFLLFLLSWLLGLALGVTGVWYPLVLLAAAAAGGATLLLRQRQQIVFACLALVWLGFVRAGVAGGTAEAPCDFALLAEAASGDRLAKIITPARLQEQQVQVTAQFDNGCRALVTLERFAGVREGDAVELTGGELQSLAEVGEYSPGYAGYLERQGIAAAWRYPRAVVIQQEDLLLSRWHELVRARVASLFVEPDASVVMAVLFAERGTLPEALVAQFRATGVSHVLAISGLHVSLLTGMLVGLMLLLPTGPKTRTALTLVLLWLYIIFIGAPTSAVRAASFWTVTLAALRLHLLVSLPTVLLLAAGTLSSLEPAYLADVGFQLSVSAVAGIFLALFLSRPHLLRLPPLVRAVASLALVSLGATLATGPLVAYHFGNVALAGVVANLLVVPLVPALLALAIVALLLSLFFMSAALLVALLLHGVIAWISFATGVIAAVPGLFFEEVIVPLWFMPLYYLAFAAASALLLRRQGRRWREVWAP
jgi:competence protein ComEC